MSNFFISKKNVFFCSFLFKNLLMFFFHRTQHVFEKIVSSDTIFQICSRTCLKLKRGHFAIQINDQIIPPKNRFSSQSPNNTVCRKATAVKRNIYQKTE